MIRRRSLGTRLADVLPVVLVLGMALGGVFVAMNVLVVAAPVAILGSPSPAASLEPSLAGSPSMLPGITPVVSPSQIPTASLPAGKPVVIRSVISASDPSHIWSVYFEYPTFKAGSTPWADGMNVDMANEMQTRALQWEQGSASIRQVSNKTNVLSGTFTIELLTSALACFTISWIDDSSASTPASAVETVNFDLSTGQRIGFDSMFSDTGLALNIISSSAATRLADQLGPNFDEAVVSDGIAPARANFENWALTTAGLKITFQEHQVSLSGGVYSVVVPWPALSEAMVTTGPVAALAGLSNR
jgi:hypothetical protein